VGVIYPEDDIFGEYNLLFYDVLAIAIAGLLLLFVLCTVIIHHMLRPLNLLTNSAKKIAEGDYNENIPETHRRDELGRLQDNFRQMQQKLATQVNELEQVKGTLNERGEKLRETYRMAKEADRMKTAVLNNMTNRMITPADAIENDVDLLHHSFKNISQEEANDMTDSILKHGENITELLNQLITVSESDTRKEEEAP
jgi:methyl-accepting chemotaxis protein